MLSTKTIYDELKALIIEQYMEEHFPKSKELLTTDQEKQQLVNDAVRKAKIELLERILEVR